jgi:hypothetical protein
MAVLTLSFTRNIAFKLAALQPSIEVADADWPYLSSLVLDQTGVDRYSVPPLIKQLASSEGGAPDTSTILVATARHIFSTSFATRQIDFYDFQNAIFSLVLAEAFEEAAMRLILSLPSFAKAESFEPFEFLFLVLNGEPIHAKLPDPGTRWMLLNAEVGLRLQDPAHVRDPRIARLLTGMRLILHEDWSPGPAKSYSRAMHHITACLARARRAPSNGPPQPKPRLKFVGSVQCALKLAILSGDQELILTVLRLYDQVHAVIKRLDVELINRAILAAMAHDLPLSAEALVTTYARYVGRAGEINRAVELVRSHAVEYLERGMNAAYFACVHAEATALVERFNQPQQARKLMQDMIARANELGLSAHCLGRAELLVAETFWVGQDYSASSCHYERALGFEHAVPWFEQYATERLCDSWVSLGKYKEAASVINRNLRSHRSRLPSEAIVQFQARLAYTFTLAHDFKKAAISCHGLCRTAEGSDSDELRSRAVKVVAWVLAHIDSSDPAAVRDGVEITNSSALSERCPPEQVEKLHEVDPAGTTGIFLTAIVFELAGDLRRSEALFCRALRTVETADKSNLMCLAQLSAYGLRACAVQLKRRRFAGAAASFKQVLSSNVEMARCKGVNIATDGPVAAELWDRMATAARECTDDDLLVLFESLCGQFGDNEAVVAWLRFRESVMLFDRGSVQAAKLRVVESERLAQKASDKLLIAEVMFEKLFNRIDEFYSFAGSREAWLADALDSALVLAGDAVYSETRTSFANNIRAVSRRQAGLPFDWLNAAIARFQGRPKDQTFLVVAYAMWHAATKHRLIVGSVNHLEAYLRQNAPFLSEDDFR